MTYSETFLFTFIKYFQKKLVMISVLRFQKKWNREPNRNRNFSIFVTRNRNRNREIKEDGTGTGTVGTGTVGTENILIVTKKLFKCNVILSRNGLWSLQWCFFSFFHLSFTFWRNCFWWNNKHEQSLKWRKQKFLKKSIIWYFVYYRKTTGSQ